MFELPSTTSDRTDRLRSEIVGREGSFPEGANPFTRSPAIWHASLEPASPVQARASYLHQVVRLARIVVEPVWPLAGNHLATAHLGIPLPDPASAEDVRLMGELGVPLEDVKDVRDAVSRWQQAARFIPGEGCTNNTEGLGHWGKGDTHTVYWPAAGRRTTRFGTTRRSSGSASAASARRWRKRSSRLR